MENSDNNKILHLRISGGDQILFNRLRKRLLDSIDKCLDSVIDYQTGTTFREETKKLTSLALNFAEEKLKSASIENQKMLAEIEEKYAIIERNKAEIRKMDIESRKLEFEQNLRELTLTLRLSKVLIVGNKDEESVIFVKDIDNFLKAIEEISEVQKSSNL